VTDGKKQHHESKEVEFERCAHDCGFVAAGF